MLLWNVEYAQFLIYIERTDKSLVVLDDHDEVGYKRGDEQTGKEHRPRARSFRRVGPDGQIIVVIIAGQNPGLEEHADS